MGNAVEVLQPPIAAWLMRKWESIRFCCFRSDDGGDAATSAPRRIRYAESQCELLPYDSTIDDYVEVAIQFAMVNFFVVAFPLAPAVAWVNNIVEHRLDAIKLVFQARVHMRQYQQLF